MHFKSKLANSMIAREFRSFLPVRDEFLFPLPLEALRKFRRPAIGNPAGILVGGRTTGTTRKTDNDTDPNLLSQLHCFAKSLGIAIGYGRIGMDWIPVAAKRANRKIMVGELSFPRAQLAGVS